MQIIYKHLFNVCVELKTDSEDQQKPPQPENMCYVVGDIAGLFTNRPLTNKKIDNKDLHKRDTTKPNQSQYIILVTNV